MKLFYKVLLSIFFINGTSMYAQETPVNVQELSKEYANYFTLNRETVFLHLNKTSVVPSEDIWFSAYVYNTKFQEPNLSTTNLHVNLYNIEGKLMEAKTVFITNGQGAGYFELDSLYSPGKYVMKASTNYMKNFREDLAFSQTFTILGENKTAEVPIKYDLQLLPEGGHFVANVSNTIGVKLIDHAGKGVYFTDAKVLAPNGKIINTFKSNRFGISKFIYLPKEGEKYEVVLTTEKGRVIHKDIPEAQALGITMSTSSMLPDAFIFSIKTNKKTFDHLKSNIFFIAYHRDGMMKGFGFVIPKNSLEANIEISKEALFPGINIITIFNQDMKPLLERMVFHRDGVLRKHVTAQFNKRKSDSLIFDLQASGTLGAHAMSISVLPAGTTSYRPNHNILSAFYLQPYVRGNLENGTYYFSEDVKKRRRNYDLNLLLLSQGWSKYSWYNVFNNTPQEFFEAEHGFTIKGGVNNDDVEKGTKLFLKMNNGSFYTVLDLKKDNSFILENVFLHDSAMFSVGKLTHRKKLAKPSIYTNILPLKDNTNLSGALYEIKASINFPNDKDVKKVHLPENFTKNSVALEAILFKTQKKSKIEKEREEEFFRGHAWYDKTIIDQRLSDSYFYILGLIRQHGFKVTRHGGINGAVSIVSRRAPPTFGGSPARTSVIVDNVRLMGNHRLKNMRTSEVEAIYFNHNGAATGTSHFGGVIRIKMKKGIGNKSKRKETMATIYAANGFAPKKEFYAPKYRSYNSPAFDHYGAIGWLPNVHLDKNGKTAIQVFNTAQPKINLYIEGMTAEGALISEIITIKTGSEMP